MFKRVEKRRLKKEEEEALGLDEDMKEILGMHDTDSEESASDSDDLEDENEGEGEGDEERSDLEMTEDGGEEEEEDEERSEEEGDDEEDPEVSVKQALEDPVYVVSVMPEVKACIICPGKVLKSVKMAHERRVKQFKTLAADADPNESAWGVLQRNADHKPKFSTAPSSSGESKRAQKKKAHAERQKQRREKQKLKRIETAKKEKEAAAAVVAASGSSASTPANPPTPVDTSKSEKSKLKTANPKSKKPKNDKKEHLPDDVKPSEPLDSTSPPKKKRKVTADVEGDDVTPKVSAPPIPDSAVQKEKRGKGRPRVAPGEPSDEKKKSKDTVDSVKSIVRSTSDRAKNARARALSAAKGRPKDSTGPRKKVHAS